MQKDEVYPRGVYDKYVYSRGMYDKHETNIVLHELHVQKDEVYPRGMYHDRMLKCINSENKITLQTLNVE